MENEFIGLLFSLVVAIVTYALSKSKEREAEWRKEKLAYYKAFIESMSGVIEGDATVEGHRQYARATNNLLLFAPQSVITALNKLRIETAMSNTNRTKEAHDRLLSIMLLAIRKDVGVNPNDDPQTFEPILWASGVGEEESKMKVNRT